MAVHNYQASAGATPHHNLKPNTFPLLYIAVLAVLLYSVFLVIRSVYVGASSVHMLQIRQAELDQLSLQVEVKTRYVAYQKTPSYIEKQARLHFGYAQPGETVVIVPDNAEGSQELADEQAGRTAGAREHVTETHLQQWWDYYFGR